jgi:hypothetical protein
MIALAALALLAAQGPGAGWQATPARVTVGDTVRLARRIPAPAGATLRPEPLAANDRITPLAPPVVETDSGGFTVTYTIAPFATGEVAIAMPPVQVIDLSGATTTVLGDSALVDVVSVLPDTGHAAPRASVGPYLRPVRRAAPLILALAFAIMLLAGWWAWRLRTGRPPAPAGPPPTVPAPPIDRWLAAGEPRAVAAVATERLRAGIERLVPHATRALATDELLVVLEAERPGWPLRDLREMLGALDRARFAPLAADDAAELVEQTEELLAWLVEGAGAEPATVEPAS